MRFTRFVARKRRLPRRSPEVFFTRARRLALPHSWSRGSLSLSPHIIFLQPFIFCFSFSGAALFSLSHLHFSLFYSFVLPTSFSSLLVRSLAYLFCHLLHIILCPHLSCVIIQSIFLCLMKVPLFRHSIMTRSLAVAHM